MPGLKQLAQLSDYISVHTCLNMTSCICDKFQHVLIYALANLCQPMRDNGSYGIGIKFFFKQPGLEIRLRNLK